MAPGGHGMGDRLGQVGRDGVTAPPAEQEVAFEAEPCHCGAVELVDDLLRGQPDLASVGPTAAVRRIGQPAGVVPAPGDDGYA